MPGKVFPCLSPWRATASWARWTWARWTSILRQDKAVLCSLKEGGFLLNGLSKTVVFWSPSQTEMAHWGSSNALLGISLNHTTVMLATREVFSLFTVLLLQQKAQLHITVSHSHGKKLLLGLFLFKNHVLLQETPFGLHDTDQSYVWKHKLIRVFCLNYFSHSVLLSHILPWLDSIYIFSEVQPWCIYAYIMVLKVPFILCLCCFIICTKDNCKIFMSLPCTHIDLCTIIDNKISPALSPLWWMR